MYVMKMAIIWTLGLDKTLFLKIFLNLAAILDAILNYENSAGLLQVHPHFS